MKGILFLLTLVYICVDFLPHFIDDFNIDKIELTESEERESESGEKEKEIEDLKEYLFSYIHVSDKGLHESLVLAHVYLVAFNHHNMDVFTPPPEHYYYPAC